MPVPPAPRLKLVGPGNAPQGQGIPDSPRAVPPTASPAVGHWLHPFPLGLLLGGIALSLGAAAVFAARIDRLCTERFVKVSGQIELQIQSRLDGAVQVLRGAKGFWSSGGRTDAATWQRYVQSLSLETAYPGTTGPDFVTATDEMFDDPVRREAMVRARDSGEPALSARVTRVSGTEAPEPGFLLLLPVYRGQPQTLAERREAMKGVVYLGFRANLLMKNTLGYRGLYVRYAIYDGESPIGPALLFQTEQAPLPDTASSRTTPLQIAGRRWTVTLQPGTELPSAAELGLPPFIAVSGVLIAALLYGLSLAWVRTRQRAFELAGQMTADLKRREQQLQDLSGQLARSNEDLQQFAYAASHDLKEPLRSIASSLGLIGQRYSAGLDDSAREFIGFASDGAQRLSGLIDNLLDFSQVHTHAGPLAPVYLDEVLDDSLSDLSALLDQSHVEICRGDLPRVMADRSQVLRLFENLITNAVKYSRHYAPSPQLSIRSRRDGPRWVISVADNGIGIAPEYHERIFQMFKRLHSRAEYEGNGMGLALCRRIIQRHGGEIWVESSAGEGARFFFSLAPAPTPMTGRRKGDARLSLVR